MIMSTGAEDCKHAVETDLLQDAKDEYSYSGELLVDETFKAFADSVCREFELNYRKI